MGKSTLLLTMAIFFSSFVYCQTYFDINKKLGRAVDEINNAMLKTYELQPVDYTVVQNFFKKFQNDGWIEFRYPQNECQYRAHAMARILLENGFKSNKIWSFKPALLGETNSEQLTIDDPNFTAEKVKWAYHVAPILVVKLPNNKIDTVVIDPSMFKEPVTYKKWMEELHSTNQYYTFVHPKYVQYETNPQNRLTGKWYSEGYSVDMRWISTSICKGKIFYLYIENEIKPIYSQLQEINTRLQHSNSGITQKERDGLELNRKYLTKIYEERKSIATNSANFGKLPAEYQSMLIECQEKLMECIYFYWNDIENNPVMSRCKY